MRLASVYPLICLFLISAITVTPAYVYAQSASGDFVAYSFSVGSESASGDLRLTVLENFGNGTLRTEFSASMNNTDLSIKHNVAEGSFHFPYVPAVPEINNQTMEQENVTIITSVTRVADEEVDFQGSTWVLNVSKVSITAVGTQNETSMSVTLTGDLKVFAKSGLFYSFNSSVKLGGNMTQLSITLTDTNLDLNVKPVFNMTMLSGVGGFASLGMGLASFSGLSSSPDSASMLSIGGRLLGSGALNSPASAGSVGASTTPTYYYVLIASLVGVVALVSALSIRGLRKGRRTGSSEEKPLHWVH